MKRSCPVPECRGEVPKHKFYCATHYELVPPIFREAIKKAYLEYLGARAGTDERVMAQTTLRLALAYSFAVVCERLGIPLPGMPQPKPPPPLSAVIKQVLNG